jgi:peptide/nickel transport system ATP-binding protein
MILKINGLKIAAAKGNERIPLVKGVDLSIKRHSLYALVGESGSGKSLLAGSIVRALAENLTTEGEIYYEDQNLLALSEKELNKIRGRQIGIVFQSSAASLNPLVKNGAQVSLVLRGRCVSRSAKRNKIIDLIKKVRLEEPERVMKEYPHQLSGGMKQRLLTAIGISGNPELLILDEPTKGMDVVLRNQIASSIYELHQKQGMTVLLITHDLELAAKLSDYCCVMDDGRIVACGETKNLFETSQNPVLLSLLNAERKMTDFFLKAT